MTDLNIPNLKKVIDLLSDPKNETKIAKNWVKEPIVQEIFSKYDIDFMYFLENYGLHIIEYFSSVIKGKSKIGDCPYAVKLVEEVIDRGLKVGEIFLICSNLKKSVIDFFFNHLNDPDVNMKDLFDEINFVFDQNLAGVLNAYVEKSNEYHF